MLARYLLPPPVSTFAPFTALVALQATVYRSVRDCLQYVLAMAAGATLAASLAALAGVHGWTFGILTLVALCVGKVRRLGQQGTQVAIVGFFAFSSGRGQIAYIGHLVAAVGIGALCGLAAHLVFAPARHTHHRQQAVTDLYTTMAQRVNNLADTLEASDPDRDHLRQWRRDWHGLSAECERIRRAIDTEVENGRMNPRRTIGGGADEVLLPPCQGSDHRRRTRHGPPALHDPNPGLRPRQRGARGSACRLPDPRSSRMPAASWPISGRAGRATHGRILDSAWPHVMYEQGRGRRGRRDASRRRQPGVAPRSSRLHG
ncbi:aromatic acid exporter family protein [Streptomyces sp. NPDC048550]|uniref:aromatic acid exporter family protein n=1 Tax=Streptomyces sp. NPDC048550 TaxID=3155739 RepID=UPI003428A1F9